MSCSLSIFIQELKIQENFKSTILMSRRGKNRYTRKKKRRKHKVRLMLFFLQNYYGIVHSLEIPKQFLRAIPLFIKSFHRVFFSLYRIEVFQISSIFYLFQPEPISVGLYKRLRNLPEIPHFLQKTCLPPLPIVIATTRYAADNPFSDHESLPTHLSQARPYTLTKHSACLTTVAFVRSAA